MMLGKKRIGEETMYCHHCKAIVDAVTWFDNDTGWVWNECSKCKSDDCDPVQTCEVCGEHFYSSGTRLCDDCRGRVNRILNRAVESVYELTGWKVLDVPREDVIEIMMEEMTKL